MNPASPQKPERVPAAFAEAINARQLDSAASCFARDACLVAPGATAIHGRDEIRAVLAQMIDRDSQIEIQLSAFVRAGDVVHGRQRWNFSSAAVAGERYIQTLSPTFVLRCHESDWKLAIAMPWGGLA